MRKCRVCTLQQEGIALIPADWTEDDSALCVDCRNALHALMVWVALVPLPSLSRLFDELVRQYNHGAMRVAVAEDARANAPAPAPAEAPDAPAAANADPAVGSFDGATEQQRDVTRPENWENTRG